MSTAERYDVIVIGSGAGGGTMTHHLAPSGKRILLLERGDFLPREQANWDAKEVFVNKRYESEVWLDRHDKQFRPEIYYFVGGNTKMYGSVLARFRERDFEEVEHPSAVSPAWPLKYADYEPFYTRAEYLYQVHGDRHEDPTEPPASRPYPHPAISHERRIQELSDAMTDAGYNPTHLPMGILLDEKNPLESKCIRCNSCGGFPCMVHAKSDAEVMTVRPAMELPNVTLRTRARVTRLETSPDGREVSEVVVDRDGTEERYTADIVILAAGACNTTRLLLMSANDQHPRGLANGSDQVGRNFMLHNRTAMIAMFRQPNPTSFQTTLGMNDFYFEMDDFPYPVGRVQMLGKLRGDIMRGKGVPLPTMILDKVAHHAVEFLLTNEDLPDPENRVTVTKDGRLKVSYVENNLEGMRRLERKMKSIMQEIGRKSDLFSRSISIIKPVGIDGIGHQSGTCRMGTDPAESVLDLNCKAHELENLYVVDASFFPTVGACNPTLTIIANSLRVGDHILERLGVTIPSQQERSNETSGVGT